MKKPYSVHLWGSHPDAGNDDCWTGEDFATLAEARAVFADPSSLYSGYCPDAAFAEIDGPDVHESRQLVSDAEIVRMTDESERHALSWSREIAREEGMLGGCEAYNEVLGY